MTKNNFRINNSSNLFDDSYYHQIFKDWYSPLCNYCYILINDFTVAEDIVQDQFVHLWENWERLHSIESIRGYLFRSVKNTSINYLKKISKLKMINHIDNIEDHFSLGKMPLVNEIIESKELEQLIDNAIVQLPSRSRTVFMLKRFDELSNKEIAEQLDISVKTVEAHMSLALKRLYQYISDNWDLFMALILLAAV